MAVTVTAPSTSAPSEIPVPITVVNTTAGALAPTPVRGSGLSYCSRCVLPDSRPGLSLDAEGVCTACRTHERRDEIDWPAREAAFESLVARARERSSGYDCLIPVSGGKDSTWQVVSCLQAGLRPLCVTWRPPLRTAVGQRNLDNLVELGVDHIDYRISPDVERRFARAAFARRGDPGIPMHMALFAIPLTLAVRLRIPMVVWGENSAVEYGGDDGVATGHRMDGAWLERYGVTGGTTWRDWVGAEGLTERDLAAYRAPDPDALAAAGVEAVFLGHYRPWDPLTTARIAHQHGFRADPQGARTGRSDAADIDDELISVHHWLKWHKFGFTRTYDNLALEIRNGRMTRHAAVDELRARGDERPRSDIVRFCGFVGIEEDEFERVADGYRDRDVWTRADGRWRIEGFLIPEWDWG